MTGCKTAILVGAIAGAGAIVAVIVIAKYKANPQQIAAAEEQVRAIYAEAATPASKRQRAHVNAETKHAAAPAEGAVNAAGGRVADGKKPQAAQADVPETPARPIPSTDELDTSGARHLPHYLAVPVPPQNIPEEKDGKATYMLWDTHRQQLATDDVYVLKNDVRNGKIVKLDGFKAKIAKAE